MAGIYKNGGTCGLIRQSTKNLTNIYIFFFLILIKKKKKKFGIAWLSSVRIVKCRVNSLESTDVSLLYIYIYIYCFKVEVKSTWSKYIRLHMCYKDKNKKAQKCKLKWIFKNYLSSDYFLKLKNMKKESLVIIFNYSIMNVLKFCTHCPSRLENNSIFKLINLKICKIFCFNFF